MGKFTLGNDMYFVTVDPHSNFNSSVQVIVPFETTVSL